MRDASRVVRWAARLAAALALVGASIVAPPRATAARSSPGASESGISRPAAPSELIWVASANSGPVSAYQANGSGSVTASRRLANPKDPNTFWDPWGVAVGAEGDVYVQSFLSDATTFVWNPTASGHAKPARIFRAQGPDNRAIAVDSQGYAYIAGGESSAVIAVVAPGANGQPSDLYTVTPLRTIQTDEAVWHPWPDILTTDGQGEVIAALVRGQGNAVEVFPGGAGGSPNPTRVISGPHTRLGSCRSAGCHQVAVTSSSYTGRLYVAVSGPSGAHINVFPGNASGDASPLATIAGPHTGLAGEVVTGIAVSSRTGDIYLMVKAAQFGGSGRVEVFAGGATGDAAPLRSFTDAVTGFADAEGIAIA